MMMLLSGISSGNRFSGFYDRFLLCIQGTGTQTRFVRTEVSQAGVNLPVILQSLGMFHIVSVRVFRRYKFYKDLKKVTLFEVRYLDQMRSHRIPIPGRVIMVDDHFPIPVMSCRIPQRMDRG